MKIKDYCNVIIDYHPYADSLKKKLIEESVTSGGENNQHYTNIVGKKLNVDEISKSASSRVVKEWVENLIRHKYHFSDIQKVSYDATMWFSYYNKDDYCKIHNHLPFCLFSFVYFVQCPRGSSPLVFETSGTRIKAEQGKVVIFPSIMKHGVPKNRCDGRLALVGNLAPIPGI